MIQWIRTIVNTELSLPLSQVKKDEFVCKPIVVQHMKAISSSKIDPQRHLAGVGMLVSMRLLPFAPLET